MWPNGLLNIISRGSRSEPYIYLTFDDGPDPVFTPRVLDILAALNVHATFFVVGIACQRHPELLRRILREGHAIGNHSFSHRHPWTIPAKTARMEVRLGFDAISDIGNHPPQVFRPPYGRLRKAMLEEAELLGLKTVLWNRSGVDWGTLAKPTAIARRLASTRNGDILLLHDAAMIRNHPEMVLTVLPGLINSCYRKSLQFVTVDRLAVESATALH
ncbi:MAG TPA: polysaccharide deacetylase family protein [Gammaproteobacteria bacterium]